MTKFDFSKRDGFSSRIGAIAAAAGSAVGLGNIWRFPYIAGENGGGAFILIYIGCILLLGIPVMLSEFVIGRSAQRNPIGAFKLIRPKGKWYLIGVLGVLGSIIILAFYSTVAGWTLEYLFQAVSRGFKGKDAATLNQMFTEFQSNGLRPSIWQILFISLTAFIVYKGIKNGIEKYNKILMPALAVIIIGLGIRSVTLPGAQEGLAFLFRPDFSKINSYSFLEALGQAFFSLSLGMGTMITYGSYMSKKDFLPTTALSVSASDLVIALLAGIAIFPAVFAFKIAPGSGPGLVFITLPMIFEQMPGGYFFSTIFFLLLTIAALTSTISLLEVIVASFSEEYNISRKKVTLIAAIGVSILGVTATLSQGPLTGLRVAGKDLFDLMEYSSANIMLPLAAFLIVLFLGWKMNKKLIFAETSNNDSIRFKLFNIFYFIVRYIAPIAIVVVFLYNLGIF